MISNEWINEMENFYKELIQYSPACIAYNYSDIEIKLNNLKEKHPIKGIICVLYIYIFIYVFICFYRNMVI